MQQSQVAPFEVLIVDDEPGDVELIRSAIVEGRFTCRTHVACDGVEAMAFMRKEGPAYAAAATPDLVLLDLNMPRMTGREVLAAMQSTGHLARIPVVVLTTSDVERDVLQAYDLGASGFVTKPVDIEQLYTAIHGIQDYWFGVVRKPGMDGNL
ncbi:CheY-like receiver protein [Paramagnetospirillum caucaseum]|uniref:CheY-like receiver protein n=1 Tax=Paramagnetospirillum caucaseum TaxID=1244869 RepID=M2ZVB5_9PROT|nr:response regulator [Paramagnetospirillum caucaseum]EME71342.1 CheY-like receiver protein [Paramagnetospirillum caucaseum]